VGRQGRPRDAGSPRVVSSSSFSQGFVFFFHALHMHACMRVTPKSKVRSPEFMQGRRQAATADARRPSVCVCVFVRREFLMLKLREGAAVVQVSLICMALLSPVCCESAISSSTRLETDCGSVTLKERPEMHGSCYNGETRCSTVADRTVRRCGICLFVW
jgi:hypothetical protein